MKGVEQELAETASQIVDRTWKNILRNGQYPLYIKMNLEPYKKDLELGLKPDGLSDPIFEYLQAVRMLIKSWNGHSGS